MAHKCQHVPQTQDVGLAIDLRMYFFADNVQTGQVDQRPSGELGVIHGTQGDLVAFNGEERDDVHERVGVGDDRPESAHGMSSTRRGSGGLS